MRIGLLTTSFPREAGDVPGLFVLGFARALAELGHGIEVLAPHPGDGKYQQPPAFAGVSVSWVRYLPRSLERTFYGAGVIDNLQRDPRAWLGPIPFTFALAHAARQRAAAWDAVVSHWALPCALVAGQLGRLRGRPLPHLAILHSADVHLIERLPGSSLLAREVARSAQNLVFSSRDLRSRFLARLEPIARLEAGGRAHVSAMGVEVPPHLPESRKALRRKLGLSQFTVLSLGRLVPIKGVDVLIRAVARLEGVSLVVAGDGPERAQLEDLARELALPVRFVGELRDHEKTAWLRAADVFALASRRLPGGRTEGMPVSLLEAMAQGLPAVATRAGGVVDVVTDGENGLLVPPDDVAGLALAIDRLREPSLRARLAAAAKDCALDYTWPRLAPRFEALLTGES